MKALLCLLMFLSSLSAFAVNDRFKSRYEFLRTDDGSLKAVVDKSLMKPMSFKAYLKFVQTQLQSDKNLYRLEEQVDRYIDFSHEYDKAKRNRLRGLIIKALKNLQTMNFRNFQKNPQVAKVFKFYQQEMDKALEILNLKIIAHVQDKSFYLKQKITYEVVLRAINFARDQLSEVPVLNVVSHLFVEFEKLIRQRRLFHQNIMLHYLEKYSAAELGLSNEEVNLIHSSMVESKIELADVLSRRTLNENWKTYGIDQFYKTVRTANRNLRNNDHIYSQVMDRFNFAFQKVTVDKKEMIINLLNQESMMDSKPAVAYYYDEPEYMLKKRALLRLAEVGLSLLQINANLKNIAQSFLQSFYMTQSLTEGALYAHFEDSQEDSLGRDILLQNLNPFEIALLD